VSNGYDAKRLFCSKYAHVFNGLRGHFSGPTISTKHGNPAPAADLLGQPILRPRSNRPWLADRKVRRQIPHRMESCEYAAERNKYARDGLWKIGGSRQVVYAKKSLSAAERLTAIRRLTGD
jgi:hypothetical protein